MIKIEGGFQKNFGKQLFNENEKLFRLCRKIDQQYLDLPLPPFLKRVDVFTLVQEGLGDISAAAKIINLMNRIDESLKFNWSMFIKFGGFPDLKITKKRYKSFLCCPEKVKIVEKLFDPEFLILGPCIYTGWHEIKVMDCVGVKNDFYTEPKKSFNSKLLYIKELMKKICHFKFLENSCNRF